MLEELKGIPAATADDDGAADQKYFDRAAALELTIWELITASRKALSNDKHILLSRCRRTHLDAVELLLSRHASTLTPGCPRPARFWNRSAYDWGTTTPTWRGRATTSPWEWGHCCRIRRRDCCR
mmetsp:Transcript_36324/g.77471  ORF Transcript_36324/g.77471 Transcript_36324/m.77471 type:complete len:125 (+) Transcript_36324:1250-1624(+)